MPHPAPDILGCDLATQSGFGRGRAGEVPRLWTERFGDDDDTHLKICSRAMGFIATLLTDDPPDAIYIETPMPLGAAMHGKSNAKSIVRLNSLYGIIGSAAILKGVPVHDVNVKQARTVFIGEGNLKGQEAKRRCKAMCKLLGWPCDNRDESDAGAIWHFGCCVEAPRLAVVIHPGMHKKLVRSYGSADADLFHG